MTYRLVRNLATMQSYLLQQFRHEWSWQRIWASSPRMKAGLPAARPPLPVPTTDMGPVRPPSLPIATACKCQQVLIPRPPWIYWGSFVKGLLSVTDITYSGYSNLLLVGSSNGQIAFRNEMPGNMAQAVTLCDLQSGGSRFDTRLGHQFLLFSFGELP